MMKQLIAATLISTPLLFAVPAQASPCDATCTYTNQVSSLTNTYNTTMGSLSQKLASREITKTEFKTGATAAKSTFKTGLTDAKTQFKADLAQQTHTTTNTATTGN